MRETRGAERRAPRTAEQLLERAEYLGLLAGWSGEAVRTGRMVLVAGEAGVGKTTVVNEFLGGLSSRTPVLRGWCESLSTPRPLAALLDVAAQTGGPLAAAVSADPRPPDVIGVLLTTLARWPGTVLVIEDLHWADDATLDLVRLISRRIGDVPALVVVTYRDDEVGAVHPLRVLLGDLGTRPAVRRLSLAPLTEGAVAELATGTDVDAGELFRLTGGNPFYVTEVLNAGAAGVP
ncbi:MAG: AAA family ATPase, partial [Jiangellales bacterium]